MKTLVPLKQEKVEANFSPLQLIKYFFTEMSAVENEAYVSKEKATFTFDNIVYKTSFDKLGGAVLDGLATKEAQEESNFWQVSLSVATDKEAVGDELPFLFSFNVVGYFRTKKSKDERMEYRFASINGPSILYGVIREVAQTMFEKMPVRIPALPTVSFYYPQPEKKVEGKEE